MLYHAEVLNIMSNVIALRKTPIMKKTNESDITDSLKNVTGDKILINDTSNKSNKRWIACILDVAQNKNRKAYFYLYEHFAPKLKSFLVQRGVNQASAEEIVQDTFITVWQKANYYTANKAYVSTWIFTIARNKKLDRDRKNVRHMNYVNTLDKVDEDYTRDDPFQFTASTELMNTVSQLPDNQTEIIKCVYFEGKSHQATADELNITLGTVKGQIRSALNRLRTLVQAP